MKNHEYRNGKLLQTNKKFSQLKQSQKEWISGLLREKYLKGMSETGRKLSPKETNQILIEVYEAIQEKDIWIPMGEVEKYFKGKITRYIHSYQKQQKDKLAQ